jgi:Family of unknown function (DUF6790)
MVTMFPLLCWVMALVAIAIALALGPKPLTRPAIVEEALRYMFVFPLGVMGLWGFVGNSLLGQETATAIGWAPSPFQFELAMAELGIGVGSLVAAFAGKQARLGVGLVAACYLFGAGFGRLNDILGGDRWGDAGPLLVSDFFTPVAVFVLLWLSGEESGEAAKTEASPEPVEPPARPRFRPLSPLKPQAALPPPARPMLPRPEIIPPPRYGSPEGETRLEDELERARQAMRTAMSRDKGSLTRR